MKRIMLVGLIACLATVTSSVDAARVKTWHHHRPADQQRAERKGVVQTDAGTLKLSKRLKPLAKLDCSHVWAAVEDKSGNVYAATGDEGKVYKVTSAGKVSVAYEGDAAQVLCLAVDGKNDAVYAGTGPTGRVVRLDGKTAKVVCELSESYVWAIAVDPKGEGIFAATGPEGRIYKVSPDGKAKVFFETKQDHVLCLAAASDGTLYAGTDKTGRIYRIDPRGKGFVLYQAAQAEVRTLLLTDDALYAGTSGTKKRGSSGGSDSSSSSTAKEPVAKEEKVRVSAESKETLASTEKKASEKKEAAPSPSAPAAGENSVYRIALEGGVREVFRDKVLVMSLVRQGKRILAGTGPNGQLFEIDESSRDRCEVARLDHGQLNSLSVRKDGSLLVGAGDPAQLYVLEDRYRSKGTITSDVLDAKLVAKWGALAWRADVPAKTEVSVAVRSGNVSEPDDTWSDWSEDVSDAEAAKVDAPAARYLQYRVTLKTDDPAATPALSSLTIRYATTNQAPEVTKVEVPDVKALPSTNPKKMKFEWAATDANEDELRYKLYVQKDGWRGWVELEDDLEKTDYEWDTTTTPSGTYRLKVVASDHADNPEKEALTGERISEPFVVCHVAPEVKVKTGASSAGKVSIEATAASPLVRLTSASFTINGKKGQYVFPTDTLFDAKKESFAFQTDALKPGTYVLVLKVTDAAGNVGSGDVVFTVPADKPVARK